MFPSRKAKPIYSSYADCNKEATNLVDDIACDFVMLSNWNTIDDNSDSRKTIDAFLDYPNEEIYYGFNQSCVHQLHAGDDSDFIPVTNLNEIFVRANRTKSAVTRVFFSCWKFIE